MKLYTEEQLWDAIEYGSINHWSLKEASLDEQNRSIINYVNSLTFIELPSDEEIFWNTKNPLHIDNYIVHRGAEGVSLGWWNGKEWIEMWGSKKINVNGWIKIPNTPIEWMKKQITFNTKEE